MGIRRDWGLGGMHELFLLRHGKSAWPDGIADHARPLAPRGERAVPLVAARLAEIAPRIDLALVSDARRTRETFAKLAEIVADIPVRYEPTIYEARPGTLFSLVRALPETARTVLMVGHNPGFQALGLYLAVSGNHEAYARLERKLPTSGLIHLAFRSAWKDARQGSAELRQFITPAMLGGVDED